MKNHFFNTNVSFCGVALSASWISHNGKQQTAFFCLADIRGGEMVTISVMRVTDGEDKGDN